MKRKKHHRVAKRQQETSQTFIKQRKHLYVFAFLFVIGAFIDGLVIGYFLTKLGRR
ncbi:MAG: hypothetical protein FWG63_11180 [Defluviitaleaceae bacterium]|nr:hypothetical protein [Defluviitaleaceae bacterium]